MLALAFGQRRQARLAELGFANLASYLHDRYPPALVGPTSVR